MSTPADGLARLVTAARSGELDELCIRRGLRVLTAFGSAARRDPGARDLDVAVFTEPGVKLDVLGLVNELVALTGVQELDLSHLNRASPVLRERALVGCVPLFESAAGHYASAQTAAIGERIETDPMRRLNLELLAR